MPPHPSSRFNEYCCAQVHAYCMCVRACVYMADLSKKLLLYECTGRACGEVKTLRAHPVWDCLCPVVVPLTPKHTQIHTDAHSHSG